MDLWSLHHQGELKTAKHKADSVQRPGLIQMQLSILSMEAPQMIVVCRVLTMWHNISYFDISFEHRPRRLDDVQKDIANIAQKIADMAAEEALVGSLGCITKGVISASSESFPHFPHFPLGL